MPPVAHQFAMVPVLVGETVVQGSVIGRCRGEGVGAVGKLYFCRYMVEGGFPAVNAYDFGFERRGELYAQAGGAGTPGMVVVQVNVTSLVGVIAIFYESELGHHLFTALSQKGEEAVSAVKLIRLMGMGIRQGDTVTVTIRSGDEAASRQILERFFQDNL